MKKISATVFIVTLGLLLAGCTGADTNDIGSMLQNLSRSYPAIMQFLAAFSYVSGIWLMFTALYKFKRYAETRGNMMAYQMHIGQPLIYLLGALILFYFPNMVSISIVSLYGSTSVVSYPDVGSMWAPIVRSVMGLVRIVGYIAFIRGWLIFVRMGSEGSHSPGTFAKASLHIIGGILAINIVGTMNVIKASLD